MTPDLRAYADAIAAIESAGSGDYSAVGPRTAKGNRAYGRYQVMDFNVGPWTEKYLGRRMTPEEFLANPQAQDAVFAGEFGGYVQRYGNPQDAASIWFTGRPVAQGAGAKDILGTTGAGYVGKFNRALGQPAPIPKMGYAAPQQMPMQPPVDPLEGLGIFSRLAAKAGIEQSADNAPIVNLWNVLTGKRMA